MMRNRFLAAIAAIAFIPCLALAASTPSVTAKAAWFRYLLPQIPAGGFVTLRNEGNEAAILTGAQSPACGMTMLHKSVSESGVERMIHVKSVTIPAHGTFRFHPGAYHIMCMKPKMKVGQTVDVTFTFANAPSLTVPFVVYGADGHPAAS